MKSGKKGS